MTEGQNRMKFGKHKGRTLQDVKDNEPGYASWVLKQEGSSGQLKEFQDFCRGKNEFHDFYLLKE
mgnify:CR=1 FL=1